jgi:flavorubredoxin
MKNFFQPEKLTDSIYWVGAIDWDIRDFHGYSVKRGTTYNAYLVMDDTVTLIDTVKSGFVPEMMARISKVVDPEKIDCIVSNHAEMDHSGGLPEVLAAVRPQRLLASRQGAKALRDHFPDCDMTIQEVQTGETFSIGTQTLQFIETRMLHWPDSMFTYVPEEKLLFSQDAFGMHLATAERFADQVSPTTIYREMAKYFANILMPYSPLILKLLDTIKKMNLDIDIVANDHGPVFRRDISNILDWYRTWSTQRPTDKAVIIYETMWGSTQTMAKVIADGVHEGGGKPVVQQVNGTHRSDIATELLFAGALVAGSPTLNNNLFPTMADTLYYLKGLQRKNLVGAVFGSYGWSGEATGQMKSLLEDMNVEILGERKIRYVPKTDDLNACYKLGVTIGNRLSENRP